MLRSLFKGSRDTVDCDGIAPWFAMWFLRHRTFAALISAQEMLLRAAPRDPGAALDFMRDVARPAHGETADRIANLARAQQADGSIHAAISLQEAAVKVFRTHALVYQAMAEGRTAEIQSVYRDARRWLNVVMQEEAQLRAACLSLPTGDETQANPSMAPMPPKAPDSLAEESRQRWAESILKWQEWRTNWDALILGMQGSAAEVNDHFIVPEWQFSFLPVFRGKNSREVLMYLRYEARLHQGRWLYWNTEEWLPPRDRLSRDAYNAEWGRFSDEWWQADHRLLACERFAFELWKDVNREPTLSVDKYRRPRPWDDGYA